MHSTHLFSWSIDFLHQSYIISPYIRNYFSRNLTTFLKFFVVLVILTLCSIIDIILSLGLEGESLLVVVFIINVINAFILQGKFVSSHVIFYVHSFPCVIGTYFSSVQASYLPNSFFISIYSLFFYSAPNFFKSNFSSWLCSFSLSISPGTILVLWFWSFLLTISIKFCLSWFTTTQLTTTYFTSPPLVGHPMITRSKAGICKLKSYLSTLLAQPSKPTSVSQALSHPMWFKATQ